MLSDADLVERSRRRDAQAFGSLVERHHKLVFGVAFAKCRDGTLAEDIAQDAFVVAWSDLGRLRDADRVGSWIAGIARNLAAQAARQRARVVELPELASARTPEDEALDREDRELLQGALESVPEAHREALVLYYFEGQSIARIAEGLDIREDLVKQRLTRGRNALRDNIAARVESALGRMRPRAGFGAGVLAAIGALENTDAVAATTAAGPSVTTGAIGKAGVAVLVALAIGGGVAAVAMRTHAADGERDSNAATSSVTARAEPAGAAPSGVVAASPPPPAPTPAGPVGAPSAEESVMDALDPKQPRRKAPPVAVQRPPGNYELHTVDGYSIVHLGAGAPATKPFGGPSTDRTRTITGRVLGRNGEPVANAIVLTDRGFNINPRSDMMATGGAITDAVGAFSVAARAEEAYVLALARDDWSEIAAVRDKPLELRVLGHGALAGRFTHDGEPETFTVHAAMQGTPFTGRWQTTTSGTLSIPSLPPGRYKVSVGLAQSMFGGQSRTLSRDVTIADGKTTELELAFDQGTAVMLTAKPPAGTSPRGITYWLFTGSAPRDGADARARKRAEDATSLTLGGGAVGNAAALHDVAPGTYYACAGFFDPATMDAQDRPFGCTKISIDESDAIREADIVLVP